jgi:hypothetical protein
MTKEDHIPKSRLSLKGKLIESTVLNGYDKVNTTKDVNKTTAKPG